MLGFELANVCLIKSRHPAQLAALAAAFRLRDELALERAAVDPPGVRVGELRLGAAPRPFSCGAAARKPPYRSAS